ncbi:MAG: hypothetical protein ACJAVY_001323 [Marinoscillum sp.]|jgi:hypothetical protein
MNKLADSYDDEDFPLEVDLPFHDFSDNEEDVAFFEIEDMNKLISINRLAAEFYSMNGRIFLPESDFYQSTHPEEQGCFYKACLSFYLIEALKEQDNG